MEKIDSAIDRIVTRIVGKQAMKEHEAFKSWNEIVGTVISRNSVPVKVLKGVLYVSVKNSTWRQELIMRKPEILKKFAVRFGDGVIRDIRLQ